MMKGFAVSEAQKVDNRAEESNKSVEESFVNVDAEVEKDMRIIRAIEALKQMGYSDDGGWLTRLTIAKEGNLNSVLDAIAPK